MINTEGCKQIVIHFAVLLGNRLSGLKRKRKKYALRVRHLAVSILMLQCRGHRVSVFLTKCENLFGAFDENIRQMIVTDHLPCDAAL